MANTILSPNMNMPIPVVSTDPGPDWANNINASLNIVDSHSHVPGQGIQITPNGIDINTDLPFNANNATTVKSVRYSPQSAPLSGTSDLGCTYESGVDLYYNDGNGNQVRITQSGSVTGSAGTITGLPSGTASASYAAGTFTFQSATNTPANMAVGPIAIGQNVANGKTVTLSPDVSQASNYALTFPLALPASTSMTLSDSSGNLSFSSIVFTAEASLPTITFINGTAPTSLTASGYKWSQNGKIVTLIWRALWSGGGSLTAGVAGGSFQLPGDCPTPTQWSAGGSAGISYDGSNLYGSLQTFSVFGSGSTYASGIACLTYNDITAAQWVVYGLSASAASVRAWSGQIQYQTA